MHDVAMVVSPPARGRDMRIPMMSVESNEEVKRDA